MADEIKIRLSVTVENGLFKDEIRLGQLEVDQSAQEYDANITVVGQAAEEDLSFVDITTLGYMYLRNLDSTNFITYGPKSGGVMIDFGRIDAGEIAFLRLEPGITFRWQADTADVKVLWKLYGN